MRERLHNNNRHEEILPMLTSSLSQNILRLTLSDHASRNALSEAMMDALRGALETAENNADVKVIIIDANGPAFSAGHNLKEMHAARGDSDGGRAYFAALMEKCSALMQAVTSHPKPIIAQIDGVATAAGCQLVASCDLAYASSSSSFGTPGVNIGLFCSTPMVAVSRSVSPKQAMEMLLTGERISARHAEAIGLITAQMEASALPAYVTRIAQTIARKSPKTLKIGKQAFYQQRDMDLAKAYDFTSGVMTNNLMIRDAEEGIAAFLEKRDPQWED